MRLLRIILFIPLLYGLAMVAMPPTPASAQVFVSVTIAPPELPVYEQPPIPGYGYIWTPGYWAYYEPYGFYWVPGTWVRPPTIGFLWTPGYWGWNNGVYIWNAGYWGPHVGFYGGINYGYGYFGSGFEGGYWQGGSLYYNTAYTNIGHARMPHVYNRTVAYNNTARVSHHGGQGGINAQPSAQEQAWARERHVAPTGTQTRHETLARSNPQLRAAVNKGNPPIGATPRPGQFGTKAGTAAPSTGKKGGQPQGNAPTGKGGSATGQKGSSGTNVQGGQHSGGQPQGNAPASKGGGAPAGKGGESDKGGQGDQKKQP